MIQARGCLQDYLLKTLTDHQQSCGELVCTDEVNITITCQKCGLSVRKGNHIESETKGYHIELL